MRTAPKSLQVPATTKFFNLFGEIDRVWINFFRELRTNQESLGTEKSFELTNNQAVAADVEGLKFDYAKVSAASIHYLIQRVTTGGGATELVEQGNFRCTYLPTSNSWSLSVDWTPGPHASGVTFSITSLGQVQYTSSNVTGTASISKLYFRATTLAGKNYYSGMGD